MNAAIKKARERLDEVISKGEEVLTRKRSGSVGDLLEDERGYMQFRMLAKTVLQKLDPNGHFEGEFQFIDGKSGWGNGPADRLPEQLGVLEALRSDFDDRDVSNDRQPSAEDEATSVPASGDTDDRPLVFISCGQFTPGEIYLGKAIVRLVEEQTGAVGYFAKNQTSLDGLTEHIFRALDKASGFIAVMHKRGQVMNEKGHADRTRASVWVEQEIAIASFLQKTRNADLKVQAYIEKEIALEGAREKLMLNPKMFTTNSQIIKHLKKELQTWKLVSPTKMEVKVGYEEWRELKQDWDRSVLHKYMLRVTITNQSKEAISSHFATLKFPSRLIAGELRRDIEIDQRRTPDYRYFREDDKQKQRGTLEPGESTELFNHFEYQVNDNLFHSSAWAKLKNMIAEVKVYVNNKLVGTDSKPIKDLNHF
jgi:hypothetical protein